MTKNLMMTAAVLAAALPGAAYAQCVENFDSITCSGTQEGGVVVSDPVDYIGVGENAIVRADDTAVTLASPFVVIDIDGLVEAGNLGISAESSFDARSELNIGESGRIVSQGDGVAGAGGGLGTLFNDGLIEARGGYGVSMINSTERVFARNNGTITASGDAFAASDRAELINSGIITSTDGIGARLGDRSVGENSGLIEGRTGFEIRSGLLRNDVGGEIVGTEIAGVQVVASGSRRDDMTILNGGVIRGVVGVDLSQAGSRDRIEVLNSGLIESAAGLAFRGSDGNDLLANYGAVAAVRGVIRGDVDMADGDDYLVLAGSLFGDVRMGDGSDVIELANLRTLSGDVFFGFGDDELAVGFDIEAGFSLFDLGSGEDEISFIVDSQSIVSLVLADTFATIGFEDVGGSRTLLNFANAEIFSFRDRTFSYSELLDFADEMAVPLPAGVVLFATALGFGGLIRRKVS